METSRSSGNGLKIAALAAIGVGLAFAFSGDSKAASGGGEKVDPCKDLEDKAGPVIAKATKADLDALGELMAQAKKLNCTTLADTIAKKIIELGTSTPVTPPKTTPSSTFNAANAPDPVRAFNLAVAFSNAKPSPEWAKANPSRVASNGTYNTLYDYGADPGNVFSIKVFQSVSGLTPDGVVSSQTNAAFLYWLGHGGKRPDGSMDVRVFGDSLSIAGEAPLCTSCGHETSTSNIQVGSCCAACAKSGGSCGEESAADQLSNVVALRTMGKAFGGAGFGSRGFGGGSMTAIAGFGGGGPNRKPNVGGCSTGTCNVAGEASEPQEDLGAQKRAVAALNALRPKVAGETHPFLDAAIEVVKTNGMINLDAVPVIPGTEAIRTALQTYNNERALALA